MSDQLYELRKIHNGRTRMLLTTPDVDRAYQLLTALRTAEHQYEIAEQGGRVLSDDQLLELIEDQTKR